MFDALRDRVPATAYSDPPLHQQGRAIVERATGRPRTAPPTSVICSELLEVDHRIRRKTHADVVKALRLEAAPFHLSRRDLTLAPRVSLRHQNVGASDIAELSIAIATTGALRQCLDLDLSENPLGDTGMEALSIALGTGALPQLAGLWLRSTQVGDEGVAHLATALAKGGCRTLEGLYLQCNAIGDDGITALASSCSAAPGGGLRACKMLHLGHNAIGEAGLSAFAAAVAERRAWPALERLWLSHNRYLSASVDLAKCIAGGGLPKLRQLFLDDAETPNILATGMRAACKPRSITIASGRFLQPWNVKPKRTKGGGKIRVDSLRDLDPREYVGDPGFFRLITKDD